MKKLLIFIGIISLYYGLIHFLMNLIEQSHLLYNNTESWWRFDFFESDFWRRTPQAGPHYARNHVTETIKFIITYGYGIFWFFFGRFLINKGNSPNKLLSFSKIFFPFVNPNNFCNLAKYFYDNKI